MCAVELDHDNNSVEETSPKQPISPGSLDINIVVGNPQKCPRVGDEYQVEIPDMITEVEYFQLLMNPLDSEGNLDVSHSFLIGLPVPITWIHDKMIKNEDERLGCQSKPNGAANVDGSVKSRKCKTGHCAKKRKVSNLGLKQLGIGLDGEKESNSVKLGPWIASNTKLFLLSKGKNSHPVPGSSSDSWNESWSNAEVDGFLLGLYIFDKDFDLIKRLLENKAMGEILSFYYRKFYKSDAYLSWVGYLKKKYKKFPDENIIFTGGMQQELLSRLLTHVPEELKDASQKVSKTFAEGKMSKEDYFISLKDIFGLHDLVEAVGIGKGKADLIALAMESSKTNQNEIPSGKACSSLTSSEIIRFLTGDFHLSKAQSHDIFWEAVWPRLLAKGWHSEQPKYQWSVNSKHQLVFLITGVEKFSRRKLVKGNHYFDSVADILKKVASEPYLLELDVDGVGIMNSNEEDGRVLEQPPKLDDPSDHQRHHDVKPQVSNGSLNHKTFTIVDSSFADGENSSKIREMRYSHVDLKISSKTIHQENEDFLFADPVKENANVSSDGEKRLNKVHQCKDIVDRSTEDNTMFTIVDTSSVHGAKSAEVSELRYLPVGFKISPKMSSSSGVSERNSSLNSPEEHEPSSADGLLNSDLVADNKLLEGGPDDQLLGAHKCINNSMESIVCTDGDSYQEQSKSSSVENRVETYRDKKINITNDKMSRRTIKHQFSRRAKSARPFDVAPSVKRQRLTACAKTEKSCLPENLASEKSSEQVELCTALKSPNNRNNSVVQEGYSKQKLLLIDSSTKGNVENMGLPPDTCERRQFQLSIDLNLSQVPLDFGDKPLMMEVEDHQKIDSNDTCSPTGTNMVVTGSVNTSTDVGSAGEELIMNTRRKSTRNRPFTARVLEAFENGFLSIDRRQNKESHFLSLPARHPI